MESSNMNAPTKEDAKQKLIELYSFFNSLPPEDQDKMVERELHTMTLEWEKINLQLEKTVLETEKGDLEHYIRHTLTIDEDTPSIDDLHTTTSVTQIKTTKEYITAAQNTIADLESGKMKPAEARVKTKLVIKDLQRRMASRRERERRASGKHIHKQVRREVSKMVMKGKSNISMSMEEFSDTTLVKTENLALLVPSKEAIEQAITEQKKQVLSDAGFREGLYHGNNIAVLIRGSTKFVSWLPARCIIDPKGVFHLDWWDWFTKEVRNRLQRLEDSDVYEEEDKTLNIVKIHLFYYVQTIECIWNWFERGYEVSEIMKLGNCELFTAKDTKINCIRQVVEYFGETWEPNKTIEDQLAPRKVIRGHPGPKSMSQVADYNDFVWDYHEEIATTDCINIVRLVEFNGHVGVITKIKPRAPRPKQVRLQPIFQKNDEIIEIFVDIEAFASTIPGKYMLSTPYLICWAANYDDEIKKHSGPGCVEKFVIELLDTYSDCEICLYAWYGSGYDYQHIFKYFKDRCSEDETFIRNNSIIYSKFIFKDTKLTVHLKDPFLFILTSLDKAAKAFGVLNKGSFPHEIIKDWSDLDNVLGNWIVRRSEPVENISGKNMLITARTWDEVENRQNSATIMEKAYEYCSVDVIAMKQVWNKFNDLLKQCLGVKVTKECFTLSQLSMKIMISTLPKGVTLNVPDREEYDFMRQAIYGGRVVARNGVYEEDILYADVVSLYPSAMAMLDHPYGDTDRVSVINWNKLGIYEVTLISDYKPENYMDFVPFRNKEGGLSYNWRPYWKGTYNTYDLLIAKDQGYEIDCIRGFEWEYKGKLFDSFVKKLFQLKSSPPCQCTVKCPGKCPEEGPIRMIAKIALNGGGYGKFVQKPIDKDVYIVKKGVVQAAFDKMETNSEGHIIKAGYMIPKPVFYELDEEWDKMIVEDHDAQPRYATQVGISILSGSRYRLYNLCKQFPGMEVIYSDTDSIFVKTSSIDINQFRKACGKELGQLDDTVGNTSHGIISRMYITGPKMYAYEYNDDAGIARHVLHCKGIPTKMLKMKHFEHLCSEVDNHLKYNMMVMAKNIVSVKQTEIIKDIKQT
jgi:hypothetical protein